MGASSNALAALGMNVHLANILGESTGAVTLAGTTQTTAAPLVGSVCVVTAAAGQTGGILPAHNFGRSVEVTNISPTAGTIYPPVGGQINGLSANTGVSVPANKVAIFRCIANTGGVSSYSANVSA